MNLKEIERIVSLIQASVFKRANSHTTGMIKSHFRGSGLQFREHQVYVPGDDVRFIDWKVSAKSTNIYLKTFEEDRNVEINVFLDITSSLNYGDKGVSKLQACVEIVALLYLLAGQTHDLVKLTIWSHETPIVLPPKKGKEGLTLFISVLEKLNVMNKEGEYILESDFTSGSTELEKINQLKASLARRKEVVYLGDGYSFQSEVISSLVTMRNFHFFKIVSPLDLGEVPRYLFKSRTGSHWIGESSEVPDQRIKIVRVDDRYLDRFVRELV